MEERGRIFDDMARLATSAVGVARNMGEEMEAFVNARVERFLAKRDWVTREEFDAMRAIALAARAETEALAKRVAALEEGAADSAGAKAAPAAPRRRARKDTQ